MIVLDDWQKEILQTKGNKLLCSGRQVGKSTIISIDAGNYVINNKNKSVLIISCTERQATELFLKCLNYVETKAPKLLKKGKDRPTTHTLKLINGSIIRSLPTGTAGIGIRGFTIDKLIVDECAFVPDEVFSAVTPMLLTTGGDIVLVSTPHGKDGYFWRCFNDPTFKVFHINSEKAIRDRKISESWTEYQKQKAIEHLEREKKMMSVREYAQEYLGEFVTDFSQFFPDSLIQKCMILKRTRFRENHDYFCGMDIARLGEDQSVFSILDRTDRNNILQVENIITTKTRLNQTFNKMLEIDKQYHFKKIFIDDGGIGVSIMDFGLEHPQTKNKVEAINNRARSLDRDDKHKKKILKEDLYNNMLMLMEQGTLKLLDDDEIFLSLKSVQYEYITEAKSPTKFRIFGNYTHIAEALIRACWCARDKRLNIWCY